MAADKDTNPPEVTIEDELTDGAPAIPTNKLDADQYSADDLDGVTESLFGSGNMSYASLQAGQVDGAFQAAEEGKFQDGNPDTRGPGEASTLTGNLPPINDIETGSINTDRPIGDGNENNVSSNVSNQGNFTNSTIATASVSEVTTNQGDVLFAPQTNSTSNSSDNTVNNQSNENNTENNNETNIENITNEYNEYTEIINEGDTFNETVNIVNKKIIKTKKIIKDILDPPKPGDVDNDILVELQGDFEGLGGIYSVETLDPVEDLIGDVDLGGTLFTDLGNNDDIDNANGDTDITLTTDIELADTDILGQDAEILNDVIGVGLDPVEQIVGDIDLDLTLSTDVLGERADDLIDDFDGGTGTENIFTGIRDIAGEIAEDVVTGVLDETGLRSASSDDRDLEINAFGDTLTTGTIDTNDALNPVEDVVGDVDIQVNLGDDLLGDTETDNDNGDSDIVIANDLDLADNDIIGDDIEIQLDAVEEITGDIDLDIGVGVDALGDQADAVIDNVDGGTGDDTLLVEIGEELEDIGDEVVAEALDELGIIGEGSDDTDVNVQSGDGTISTGSINTNDALNPVEDIIGDVDVDLQAGDDLLGDSETDNDNGDSDIVIAEDVDIADNDIIGDDIEIELDAVEEITGDIDLNLGAGADLLGDQADNVVDGEDGGTGDDTLFAQIGDGIEDVADEAITEALDNSGLGEAIDPVEEAVDDAIEAITGNDDPDLADVTEGPGDLVDDLHDGQDGDAEDEGAVAELIDAASEDGNDIVVESLNALEITEDDDPDQNEDILLDEVEAASDEVVGEVLDGIGVEDDVLPDDVQPEAVEEAADEVIAQVADAVGIDEGDIPDDVDDVQPEAVEEAADEVIAQVADAVGIDEGDIPEGVDDVELDGIEEVVDEALDVLGVDEDVIPDEADYIQVGAVEEVADEIVDEVLDSLGAEEEVVPEDVEDIQLDAAEEVEEVAEEAAEEVVAEALDAVGTEENVLEEIIGDSEGGGDGDIIAQLGDAVEEAAEEFVPEALDDPDVAEESEEALEAAEEIEDENDLDLEAAADEINELAEDVVDGDSDIVAEVENEINDAVEEVSEVMNLLDNDDEDAGAEAEGSENDGWTETIIGGEDAINSDDLDNSDNQGGVLPDPIGSVAEGLSGVVSEPEVEFGGLFG